MGDDTSTPSPAGNPRFRSTRVERGGRGGGQRPDPDADRALATLCETYWYPLYAFARRHGHDAEAAPGPDAGVLRAPAGEARSRRRGSRAGQVPLVPAWRVRAPHVNERERAAAWKRGGRATLLSLDLPAAEERYCREPADIRTPEKLYERRWALTLLATVLQQLRAEQESAGRGAQFHALSGPALTPESGDPPYRALAAQLGMSETAVKVAVHRLRRRYRDLIRESRLADARRSARCARPRSGSFWPRSATDHVTFAGISLI